MYAYSAKKKLKWLQVCSASKKKRETSVFRERERNPLFILCAKETLMALGLYASLSVSLCWPLSLSLPMSLFLSLSLSLSLPLSLSPTFSLSVSVSHSSLSLSVLIFYSYFCINKNWLPKLQHSLHGGWSQSLYRSAGIEPTSLYQRTFLRRQIYTTRLSNSISTSIAKWYKSIVGRISVGTVTWNRFPPTGKGTSKGHSYDDRFIPLGYRSSYRIP